MSGRFGGCRGRFGGGTRWGGKGRAFPSPWGAKVERRWGEGRAEERRSLKWLFEGGWGRRLDIGGVEALWDRKVEMFFVEGQYFL